MHINVDGNGNVSVDFTQATNNIGSNVDLIRTIYNNHAQFSDVQINQLFTSLARIYPTCPNFDIFLKEWARLQQEINI